MAEIITSKGTTILVDYCHYELLNKYKWCISHYGYAVRRMGHTIQYMHRYLLNCPKESQVDHINRNKLDNRLQNLRICSNAENSRNKKVTNKKYKYPTGVSKMLDKYGRKKPFIAAIKVNNKTVHLGYFYTPSEAALAYNEAATKYFGEFACLNGVTID